MDEHWQILQQLTQDTNDTPTPEKIQIEWRRTLIRKRDSVETGDQRKQKALDQEGK